MRWVAPTVLVIVLAGCGSSSGKATISKEELPTVVLRSVDVPRSWSQFEDNKQLRADAPSGARQSPTRFGREGGWIARYRGGAAARSIVAESRADIFSSSGGARRDLSAYRHQLESPAPGSGLKASLLPAPKLGEAAVAAELRQGSLVFLTVAWRRSNATASITLEGQAATTHIGDALALARKQDRRLAHAAASPL